MTEKPRDFDSGEEFLEWLEQGVEVIMHENIKPSWADASKDLNYDHTESQSPEDIVAAVKKVRKAMQKNRKDKYWDIGKVKIHYIRYRSTYTSADSHWGILAYGSQRTADRGFGVDFNLGKTVFVWQFSR